MRVAGAVLSVILAFPAGGSLRALVDTAGAQFPHLTASTSDLVDANPAEAERNRFVVSTRLSPRALRARPDVVEAVPISPGRVALATTMDRRDVAALDGVRKVEPDALRTISSIDPYFGWQWGLENMGQTVSGVAGLAGADMRWSDSRGHADGRGVVVAVIDSGIDFTHPDLAHALWRNTGEVCGNAIDDDANGYVDDCNGWDFVNDDNQQHDRVRADGGPADNSHGTHVAGTIAAAADNGVGVAGVAPNVQIMPLKVIENGSFPMSRTARAIRYAVANGASVINMSWGGTGIGSDETAAIHEASQGGVMMAAAAGNEGTDNDRVPRYPSAIDVPGMVAVAASTSLDATAWFSCWGARTVDLHAPGHMILSTIPGGYGYMSGTSMAAPHVAGAAALVRSRTPDMTLGALRTASLGSVDKLPALAGTTVTGGRLDVASALGVGEDGAQITFHDFHAFSPHAEHTGQVVVTAPPDALPAGADVVVTATLGVVDRGAVRAVLDHPVNGTPTDTNAEVALSDGPLSVVDKGNLAGAGVAFPVTTALPSGDYALMVELVNHDDGRNQVIGSSSVVLFSIIDPNAPTEPAPTPSPPAPSEPLPPGDEPDPTPPPSGSDPGSPPPTGSDPQTPPPGESDPAPAPRDDPGTGPDPAPPVTSDPAPPPSGSEPPPPPPSGADPKPPPADSDPTTPAPTPTEDDDYVPVMPPPDVPGPDVPGDADPAPTQPDDDWRVFPNEGSTAGGTHVSINGRGLPGSAYVRFGATNGPVLYQDENGVRAQTPAHVAGTVDVTVFNAAGERIVLPGAFTFVAPPSGGDAPTDPSDPAPDDPNDPIAPPEPPDSGTQPPGSPPPADTIAPPADDAPEARSRTLGRPYTTASGLRVDSLAPGHPLTRLGLGLWADSACRTETCRALLL